MLVQESLVGETLHYKDMCDTIDEFEETLSFCDLALYSDYSEWEENFSNESQGSSSITSSEQDYFEFITQTSPYSPPENIFFCGKLIPYKQISHSEKCSSEIVNSNTQTKIKKKRRWGLFRSTKQVHSKKATTVVHKSQSKMYNGNKHEKGYDFPLHKMPILQSTSSGKARWYLLLFGISKISSQVELKDIKTRQSHRECSPPVLRSSNHDDKVSGRKNISSGLIRVLSCGSNHQPNTVAMDSIR